MVSVVLFFLCSCLWVVFFLHLFILLHDFSSRLDLKSIVVWILQAVFPQTIFLQRFAPFTLA